MLVFFIIARIPMSSLGLCQHFHSSRNPTCTESIISCFGFNHVFLEFESFSQPKSPFMRAKNTSFLGFNHVSLEFESFNWPKSPFTRARNTSCLRFNHVSLEFAYFSWPQFPFMRARTTFPELLDNVGPFTFLNYDERALWKM